MTGDGVASVEVGTINQDSGFPCLALLKRVSFEDLLERMRIIERDPGIETANARRWLSGERPPSPRNVWLIGEALGFTDKNVEAMMSGASGLLALFWFGHLADFVGVLSCAEAVDLMPFEVPLMAMLRTLTATAHVSPYDALPSRHEILATHADEIALRQIADTGVIAIPPTLSCGAEADAINERRVAMTIWEMPAALRDLLAAAAIKWLGDGKPARKMRGEGRLLQASRPLRHAYAIAKSNIDDEIAIYLVVDNLTQWFYANTMPEPPTESVEQLARLVDAPYAATSGIIMDGIRSARSLDSKGKS